MRTNIFFGMILCSILSGCASIMNDSDTQIRVETISLDGDIVENANCKINSKYGNYTLKSPETIRVRRDNRSLNITCIKEGYPKGEGIIMPYGDGSIFGNILLGGPIGAIIDTSTGKAFKYPDWIKVTMGKYLRFQFQGFNKNDKPNFGIDIEKENIK